MKRNKKFIKITPTGWANIKDYISMVEGEFIVPYSSHSNYEEIEQFVASLRPAVLKCVVRENRSSYQKIGNIKQQFNSYMFTLQSLKQTGYDLLVKKYTNIAAASKEYLALMNPSAMNLISEKLGLRNNASQTLLEDSRRFDLSMSQVVKAKNTRKLNKGVKIVDPEQNDELTQEDIAFIKNRGILLRDEDGKGPEERDSQILDSKTQAGWFEGEVSLDKGFKKVKKNNYGILEKESLGLVHDDELFSSSKLKVNSGVEESSQSQIKELGSQDKILDEDTQDKTIELDTQRRTTRLPYSREEENRDFEEEFL